MQFMKQQSPLMDGPSPSYPLWPHPCQPLHCCPLSTYLHCASWLQSPSFSVLITAWEQPHFTDEKMEAKRDEGACMVIGQQGGNQTLSKPLDSSALSTSSSSDSHSKLCLQHSPLSVLHTHIQKLWTSHVELLSTGPGNSASPHSRPFP